MTVPDMICVIAALLLLGFCVWLESRAIARYRARLAKEREAFLEVLWHINDNLIELRYSLVKIHQSKDSQN